jgi:hypothetical protein
LTKFIAKIAILFKKTKKTAKKQAEKQLFGIRTIWPHAKPLRSSNNTDNVEQHKQQLFGASAPITPR